MIRSKLKALALPALVLAASAEFNATEVHCEEAIAHLQSCCPGLDVPNVCGGEGCAANVTLTLADSQCALDTDCGPDADRVCQRVQDLSQRVAQSSLWSDRATGAGGGSPTTTTSHEVCP